MLVAKSTIVHNGKEYQRGDAISSEITSAEIKQLVDSGSAEIVPDAQPSAPVVSKSEAKRVEAQKSDADVKAHNVEIREKAKKYGIKTVAVKMADIEKAVLEAEAKEKGEKPVLSAQPSLEWGKIKLLGEARRRGIVADETMIPEELLAQIEVTPEPPVDDDDNDPTKVPTVTRTSVVVPDVE